MKQEEKPWPNMEPELGRGIQMELCLHAHLCKSDLAVLPPDPTSQSPETQRSFMEGNGVWHGWGTEMGLRAEF